MKMQKRSPHNRSSQNHATQNDVALLADVTRATVSYVLNGRAEELKITPAVVKRVTRAAAKLNYRPNLAARTLAAGRSRQVGLLLPSPLFVRNHYWGPIATGVERAALKSTYDVLLLASRENVFETAETYIAQNRIDAIILLGSAAGYPWQQLSVPPVVVAGGADSQQWPRVETEMAPAIDAMLSAFTQAAVRKVIWIGPASFLTSNSSDRLILLRKGCAEAGLPLKEVEFPMRWNHAWTISEEIGIWRGLITEATPAIEKGTAVVCWNDFIALGLYGYLQQRGLTPGRDVAVVGFDNQYAEAALPPLASVGFNTVKMGEAALELVLALLDREAEGDHPAEAAPVRNIPARLIIRESLSLQG
jgi:DNA-binding LacI/PurR family transcriptional regulator